MFSAFKDYLLQKSLVKEGYVPFYLKWVSDCYAFLDESDSQVLSLEQKQRFLKHLSKTHEDWQVKQADTALRHYGFFLSSQERTMSGGSADTDKAWTLLETRTREALRLRQRSYSTEKTYITWLRAFKRFVGEKNRSP